VRGYAANNSRALMRRRSSDAAYVRMCLDPTGSSNSWGLDIRTGCDCSCCDAACSHCYARQGAEDYNWPEEVVDVCRIGCEPRTDCCRYENVQENEEESPAASSGCTAACHPVQMGPVNCHPEKFASADHDPTQLDLDQPRPIVGQADKIYMSMDCGRRH
jgi:hypothetical protein